MRRKTGTLEHGTVRGHFSSPNHLVWEYFFTLRRLANEAEKSESEELSRQRTALTVIMAVTMVEVFLNLFFRVRVSEPHSMQHQTQFLADLNGRMSLDKKIRRWPSRILDKELQLDSGPGKQFMELKELRNSLVHFTSTHESVDLGDVQIHGLADSSAYDTLSARHATNALLVAESVVEAIFRLAGLTEEQVPHAMHAWTGKVAST